MDSNNDDILEELLAAGLIQPDDVEKRRGFSPDSSSSYDPRYSDTFYDLNPHPSTTSDFGVYNPEPLASPPAAYPPKRPTVRFDQDMSKRSYTDSGLASSTDKVAKIAKTTDSASAESSTDTPLTAPNLAQLVDRDPSSFSSEEQVQQWFSEISDMLLNGCIFHINDVPHRFIEIEFYYKGGVHMDHFTHGDPMQKTHGYWYFHRQGKSYRSGTYKGLDFTIGHTKAFGGVLIRAVENLTSGAIIEGPSLVVDHILALGDVSSIDDFVSGFDLNAVCKSKLYVSEMKPTDAHRFTAETKYSCPRVGLTLKKNENNQAKFIMRHYRHYLRPTIIKKGKVNIVLPLIDQGLSVDKIFNICRSPKKSIEKYMDLYESGKNKTPSSFYNQALSTDDMCELYGACSAAK